jgi:hypothetical protein
MKNFTNDIARPIVRGAYIFQATMSTGTVTLQWSLDEGVTFDLIDNGVFASSSNGIIQLPKCQLKAGITLDATFSLSPV